MDSKKITELTPEQMEMIHAGTGTAVAHQYCEKCKDIRSFVIYSGTKGICTVCGWTKKIRKE